MALLKRDIKTINMIINNLSIVKQNRAILDVEIDCSGDDIFAKHVIIKGLRPNTGSLDETLLNGFYFSRGTCSNCDLFALGLTENPDLQKDMSRAYLMSKYGQDGADMCWVYPIKSDDSIDRVSMWQNPERWEYVDFCITYLTDYLSWNEK